MLYQLLLLSFLSCLLCSVRSQQQKFSWSISKRLVECDAIPIVLAPQSINASFNGVAPFYMISYELGGIATTDFLGTDWQDLTWTVRHPQGAQVFLNVVDSAGNSGGTLNGIVQGGVTSSCHPAKPTSPIKIVADLPQVATCDSVNATITGGQKPYTISIVSTINYRSPSNFTIGEEDDVFTYVNRVAPGNSFFIAASDSTGQWAYGTNFISSVGSSDTSCPGKKSVGSQSASSTRSADMTATSSKVDDQSSEHLSNAAIGGLIAGGVTILLSASLVAYFCVRRRRHVSATNRRVFPPNVDITPFVPPTNSTLEAQIRQTDTRVTSSWRTSDYSDVPLLREPRPPSRTPRPVLTVSPPSRSATVFDGDPDPYADSRRISKNTISSSGSSPSSLLHSAIVGTPTDVSSPVFSPLLSAAGHESQCHSARRIRGQSVVVQHEDAEDVIEVPPAYRERGIP